MDDRADVVRLPTSYEGNRERNALADEFEHLPTFSAPWSPKTCEHRTTTIDKRARTLTCRRCGVPVDPFDHLDELARLGARDIETSQMLRHRIERLHQELAELDRKERNAKSRLRTARRRSAAIDRQAILAAAQSTEGMGGYRAWPELSAEQKKVVIERVERIVEAYCGALSA